MMVEERKCMMDGRGSRVDGGGEEERGVRDIPAKRYDKLQALLVFRWGAREPEESLELLPPNCTEWDQREDVV